MFRFIADLSTECNEIMKSIFLLPILALLLSCSNQSKKQPADLVLKYNQPAQSWNEALPVGNGRLGAIVFGGV